MTDRAVGCLDGSHGHRVLVDHRPVNRDDIPGADGELTLWLCPVLHTLGAMWTDYRSDPEAAPGGPLDAL